MRSADRGPPQPRQRDPLQPRRRLFWYLFGRDNRLRYDAAGRLGNGAWGYSVGTYGEDAGPTSPHLYLNGTRVAQMSDTQLIDLNSAARGTGRRSANPGKFASQVRSSSG
jgi:hypothetical protein